MRNQLNRLQRKARRAETIEEKVDAMNDLAYRLRGSDPKRALDLCREASELAREAGYARGGAYALRTEGVLAYYGARYAEAAELLDRAAPIFEELEDGAGMASVMNIRGHLLRLNRDRDGAMALFRGSLRQARACADPSAEAEALASIGTLHAAAGRLDRGLGYFRSAIERLDEGKIAAGREPIRLNIAIVHCIRGELVAASGLLFDLIASCGELGERRVESKARCQLAQVYSEMGDFAAALGSLLEAARAAGEIGDLVTLADAYRGIGIIHKRIGDYPRALECAMKSLELARLIGTRSGEASTLNNIGNIYYPMGDLDRALDYFQQARGISEEIGQKDNLVAAVENIGNVLRDVGRYDEAAACFERSRELAEEIGDHVGVASCAFNVGRMQLDRKEYDAAAASLGAALEAALQLGLKPMAAQIHNDLADLHRNRGTEGDMRLALEHLAEYMRLNEEVMSRERQRAVTEMQMRMEMEKVERERESFREESRRLQLDVEQKAQELNAMALRLVERNELLARLRGELARAAAQAETAQSGATQSGAAQSGAARSETTPAATLTRLRDELEAITRAEGEWNDFQESLRQVHHGFLLELSKRHPDLTPAELKVCALLRTQLSTKEIANLLAVSPRAVEKLRYQIRKKIGLGKEENLMVALMREGMKAEG